MTKGFIIYALGHANYYRMAETLAVSLTSNNPNCLITLLCDDSTKLRYPLLFHNVKEIPVSDYTENGKIVFNKATVRMYDYSPYRETIKLDADMIWLIGRDPMQLFEDLKAHDIVFQNRGHGWNKGNSVWTQESELKQAYGFTDEHKLYKIYGEFVYFKKSDAARSFFKTVKTTFRKPKVSCAAFAGGSFTDELAYQISCMQHGTELPNNYTPVFNTFLGYNHYQYAYELAKAHHALSIGGNYTTPWIKAQYNNLAAYYFSKKKLQNHYQVIDKRTYLPERLKL